ncbi:hypothetical protein HPNQ4076_1681 [Helicobacter pylori NQ4076]|uniref:Uncharacterized protein n=1 Tax=Helicobacter pylori NQ4076 TaxID=992029 RepID=I9Z8I9_HELPX|nr:hypothetical protein HPNQ4076_1681 [Helicobacter pylori NQ4076]
MIPNLFITLKFYQLVGFYIFIFKAFSFYNLFEWFQLKNFLKLVFKNECNYRHAMLKVCLNILEFERKFRV